MSGILWDAAELAAVFGPASGTVTGATGVSIDSRTVNPRELFVAIRGDALDGHDYVARAFEAGAAAALVAADRAEALKALGPVYAVEDTLRGLEALGVSLGERLMPARAGCNDKGFFEDLDICEINENILSAQGSHWGNPAGIG